VCYTQRWGASVHSQADTPQDGWLRLGWQAGVATCSLSPFVTGVLVSLPILHPQACIREGLRLFSPLTIDCMPHTDTRVCVLLTHPQACIREGLRLFSPAAQGSWRLCTTADITISKDFTLPKVKQYTRVFSRGGTVGSATVQHGHSTVY
jgi:hypothetical protein